jgi:hypothetical protein
LKIAYIAKALIASALILLAIAFGITLYYAGDVGGALIPAIFEAAQSDS